MEEKKTKTECECCQDGKCACQEGQECDCCKEGKCTCKEGECGDCEHCAHPDHKHGGKMHEELEALKNDEKKTMAKVKKDKAKVQQVVIEKDW